MNEMSERESERANINPILFNSTLKHADTAPTIPIHDNTTSKIIAGSLPIPNESKAFVAPVGDVFAHVKYG